MSEVEWIWMNLPPSRKVGMASKEAFDEVWAPLGWVLADGPDDLELPDNATPPEEAAAQTPEVVTFPTEEPQDAPAPADTKKGR